MWSAYHTATTLLTTRHKTVFKALERDKAMAGSRTGTPSIWKHAKAIRRLQAKYGASDLAAKLGDPFAACIADLVGCVATVYLNDNFPLEVDRVAPHGPEDIVP